MGVDRPTVPAMVIDHVQESTCTVVAFGGILSGFGLPPFEFERLLSNFGHSSILIRDLHQSWYNNGVDGLGADLLSMSSSLNALVDEIGSRSTVFIGNSAGGFGALVLGWLCPSSRTVVFSPQTMLTRSSRARHLDVRWSAEIRRARRSAPGGIWDVLDAAPQRASEPAMDGATKTDVYFSGGNRLDRLHAERLRHVPGVRLHPQASSEHGLVAAMKRSGSLEEILRRAVS